MATSFLEGMRVLDVSQYVPGPYATLMLADMGAEVVKVEPPGGDPMRLLGPIDSDGISAFYKVVNGGKSIIRLDLKSAEGKAAFAALLRTADVLVESYRPGVLDRLGFGRPKLRSLNPRLVHCALSGYGQNGPYRLRAAHDLNYMAMAGALTASGTSTGPAVPGSPVDDYASGIQAAATVLAALVGRGRTGEGAFLDVSMAETVLAWQVNPLVEAMRGGDSFARGKGEETGGRAWYRIYRTADDRFVTLGILEEKFWANFCKAVGHPDWIPRQWEALPQEALVAEVEALFASRPLAHWEALLSDVDCCYQAILEFAEVAEDPQVAARSILARESWPDPLLQVLYPAWIDDAPPKSRPRHRDADAGAVVEAWTGDS